jgi:hypothetical protein
MKAMSVIPSSMWWWNVDFFSGTPWVGSLNVGCRLIREYEADYRDLLEAYSYRVVKAARDHMAPSVPTVDNPVGSWKCANEARTTVKSGHLCKRHRSAEHSR